MGKIILEFDLQEEGQDAREALDGYKWKLSVWDLDQHLRNIVKHGYYNNKEATSEEIDFAYQLRETLREIINEYNLNLNE